MSDFQPVAKALTEGADPAMLCATCPWDRNCVTPPSMTKADVDQQIAQATEQDKRHAEERTAKGQEPGMPMGSLLTALMFGGRENTATVCPVFALRLRSSGGRRIADGLKDLMARWDDQS